MLDKELNRVLDIKEETDQKLIDAYQQIAEFETLNEKIASLLVLNFFIYNFDHIVNLLVNIFRSNWKEKIKLLKL